MTEQLWCFMYIIQGTINQLRKGVLVVSIARQIQLIYFQELHYLFLQLQNLYQSEMNGTIFLTLEISRHAQLKNECDLSKY